MYAFVVLPHHREALTELFSTPERWLPRPFDRIGPGRYIGRLRILGNDLPLSYDIVGSPGATITVSAAPDSVWVGGFESELTLTPAGSGTTELSMLARRTPPGAWFSRPAGPMTSRLLVSAFLDRVTRRVASELSVGET